MNSQVLHDHHVVVNRCYVPEQLEPSDSAALQLLDKLIGTMKNIRTVFNSKAGITERGSKGGWPKTEEGGALTWAFVKSNMLGQAARPDKRNSVGLTSNLY